MLMKMIDYMICPHCSCNDEDCLEFLRYDRQDQGDEEFYEIMIYHCNECDNDFTVEETWKLTERKITKEVK